MLLGVTLVEAGEVDDATFAHWPAALRTAARALSLSVSLQPPIAIRTSIFLVTVGAAAIAAGAFVRSKSAGVSADRKTRWFFTVGVLVFAIAVLSALVNRTGSMSLGWLVMFAAGLTWTMLLATHLDERGVDRILAGVAVLAIASGALAIWHQRSRELLWVGWPIGSVTAAGFVAATWTALFVPIAWFFRRASKAAPAQAPSLFGGVLRLAAFVMSAWLLWSTDRRGAMIAAAGAVVLAVVAHLIFCLRSRVRWLVVVFIGISFVAATLIYVQRQTAFETGRRRGSVEARWLYWRETAKAMCDRPLLGFGPDAFAAEMSTRFARRRAEVPSEFSADLLNAAHNEWLQSFFELGIPGGLLYLALPTFALLVLGRRLGDAADPRQVRRLTMLGAAIAALAIEESTSVIMRSPIGPPWYFTLLGLALAVSSRTTTDARPSAMRPIGFGRRIAGPGLAIVGTALVALAVVEFRSAYFHAAGIAAIPAGPDAVVDKLKRAATRLDLQQWFRVRRDIALAQATRAALLQRTVRQAGADPLQDPAARLAGDEAVAAWRALFESCPGFKDAAGRLAECLYMVGRPEEARAVLNEMLTRLSPLDPLCNQIMARTAELSFEARMQHVLVAIRGGLIEGPIQDVLRSIRPELDAWPGWPDRVAAARRCAGLPPGDWTELYAPEILRVETWRVGMNGRFAEARDLAEAATRCHDAVRNTTQERGEVPASETWQMLARMTYMADPRDYRKAHQAICQAEERAVRSERHVGRKPIPGEETVGGELIPTSYPDHFRSMWALSSLLHLAVGHMNFLEQRIAASLPLEARTSDNVGRMLSELALRLKHDFAAFPPDQRPANYNYYDVLIQRYNSPSGTRPTVDHLVPP